MRATGSIVALNRGVVSRLGLARTDVKRLAMAAEVQQNFIPRVLGSMMLRPGWKYLGATLANAAARYLRHIFSTDDCSLVELTANEMRVWINDVLLTRPAVSTAIVNGTFAGSLAGWGSLDEAGATSSWAGGNLMQLVGNGSARAIREQSVTIGGGNIGIEHGLRIVINRGPVLLRIGYTSGGDELVSETTLLTGTHSLSITPVSDIYIRFFSPLLRAAFVSSCTIEAAGAVAIPTPWGATDLSHIRADQSGDILYVACKDIQQRRIERRGTRPAARSWSLVTYTSDNGPFDLLNTSAVTLTPSAISGDISVTASVPMFKATHVGALFSITSAGQDVKATGSVNGVFTDPIRVTGINNDRAFSVIVSGDATGSTVTLQRSFDGATWANVSGTGLGPWTANVVTSINDGLNNQFVFYRLILTTRVAPDNVTMELVIGSGSVRGIVRVTGFVSSTQVNAAVLASLGGTGPSQDWQEGLWSDKAGWPSSVRFHEGRLWWAGANGVWGSISDAYDSFDETLLGDAGTINRSIGAGPVDTINWLMSLKGLILGAQGAEFTARASSLDEPLTPTNFNVKSSSTQGSGAVDSIKIDASGYFVDRSGVKVFDLSFSLRDYDYISDELTKLAPEIGRPGIVRMDVQRKPDTRIHCVRSDGTVVLAVVDKIEEVLGLVTVTASGFVEDVIVLPAISGNLDDQVYYVVRRTINGATVRYLEKWAQESDCLGDKQYCYLADAHVAYSGGSTHNISGLGHLEGQSVVVWADGADVGTIDTARPWTQKYSVSGGQLSPPLTAAATNIVVGLGYTAQFQSAKLGLVADDASPLNQQKRLNHLGVILANAHAKGLKFGPYLNDTGSLSMDDMPGIEQGTTVSGVTTDYDDNRIEFPGTWTTDMRVCLQAQAPRPVTVLAISFEEEQNT